MSKPVTRAGDLLERLLAGEPLVKCHGIGWTIGADAVPVPDVLVRSLQGGTFRLEVGGDGLPGIGSSQTMRLVRVPTSDDLLHSLRQKIRITGSLRGWARANDLSCGQVGDVESCARPMSPAVAAAMGFTRIVHLWRSARERGAA
jgi:hypothetical protein